MDSNRKLTGMDYLTMTVTELVQYPNFSQHAFRVMTEIANMTTEEIENLDVARFGGVRV